MQNTEAVSSTHTTAGKLGGCLACCHRWCGSGDEAGWTARVRFHAWLGRVAAIRPGKAREGFAQRLPRHRRQAEAVVRAANDMRQGAVHSLTATGESECVICGDPSKNITP
jgi:hypothetical protein